MQKLQLISIRVEFGVESEVTGPTVSVNSDDTSTPTANTAKIGMSTLICINHNKYKWKTPECHPVATVICS